MATCPLPKEYRTVLNTIRCYSPLQSKEQICGAREKRNYPIGGAVGMPYRRCQNFNNRNTASTGMTISNRPGQAAMNSCSPKLRPRIELMAGRVLINFSVQSSVYPRAYTIRLPAMANQSFLFNLLLAPNRKLNTINSGHAAANATTAVSQRLSVMEPTLLSFGFLPAEIAASQRSISASPGFQKLLISIKYCLTGTICPCLNSSSARSRSGPNESN